MIACIDTYYRHNSSRTALLKFERWSDEFAISERTYDRLVVEATYTPGFFFQRELPCLVDALDSHQDIDILVVDGYVELNGGRPGLGKKLFERLNETIPVVGVAKNKFYGASNAIEVLRAGSSRPLFVSSAGVSVEDAAHCIQNMHGCYRIPTLLKRVDKLSRSFQS